MTFVRIIILIITLMVVAFTVTAIGMAWTITERIFT